jgi:hypothetical protein
VAATLSCEVQRPLLRIGSTQVIARNKGFNIAGSGIFTGYFDELNHVFANMKALSSSSSERSGKRPVSFPSSLLMEE